MVTSTDIELRQLDPGVVAYQRFRGTIASIESVTSGVRSWVVTMGYKPEGPMAVEITGDPTSDITQEYEMEVQLPVSANAKAHPSDKVQIKPFEQAQAVVMTLRGPHELTHLTEPLAQIKAWMQEKGLPTGEAIRWVEITDPAKVAPGEQLTELQYLLPRE